MPFQAVPDCAIADVLSFVGTTAVEMTFHGQKPGGYTAVDILNLANAVSTWFSSTLLQRLSVNLVYVRTEVRGLASQNDFFDLSTLGAGVGGVVSPALPNTVAFVVKRSSAFTGRSARGRVYIPGIPTGVVNGVNGVTTLFADNVTSDLSALIAAMSAVSWTHVIVSRFTNGAPRPTGIAYAVEAYSYVDALLDNRRDRKP